MADPNVTAEALTALQENLDAFFLIVNAIIIYFMQCGFAFLECGAVRSKNATNILIKNMLDAFFGAITYWIIGYALAFGVTSSGGNSFIGTEFWASYGLSSATYSHWFFHFVFAATAATIVSGAVAERCEFAAYIIYSVFITGFVYPVVTHWAWCTEGNGEGWLVRGVQYTVNGEQLSTSYIDFAGSGVVHLLGGTAAFVGAAVLGPRIVIKSKSPSDILGHSVPLVALGGFILFFGFFAFNGGSQASISQPGDGAAVALSVMNTIISGSFGGVTALIFVKVSAFVLGRPTRWSLLSTVNGGLAGMVAICAGCNVVHPWGAAIIGFGAGLVYILWSFLVAKLGVDDPLDATAVHGGAGLWGLIATPILMKDTGIVFTGNRQAFTALGWNLVGALAIITWSGGLSLILFGSMRLCKILRVDPLIEIKGMDIPKHGEPAYPLGSYGDGWENTPEDYGTHLIGDPNQKEMNANNIRQKEMNANNIRQKDTQLADDSHNEGHTKIEIQKTAGGIRVHPTTPTA